MLNHIHISHQHNTDDGGQAMGEELRCVVCTDDLVKHAHH